MIIMPILVVICIWFLGFYDLEAFGVLMGFLEFCSLDCGYIIIFD